MHRKKPKIISWKSQRNTSKSNSDCQWPQTWTLINQLVLFVHLKYPRYSNYNIPWAHSHFQQFYGILLENYRSCDFTTAGEHHVETLNWMTLHQPGKPTWIRLQSVQRLSACVQHMYHCQYRGALMWGCLAEEVTSQDWGHPLSPLNHRMGELVTTTPETERHVLSFKSFGLSYPSVFIERMMHWW